MGFYIHRIVIDTNCINARGKMPAMNSLEEFFALGVIEILKTSVMPVELSGNGERAEKAQKYGTIYGPQWIEHTEEHGWGFGRDSRFEEIYHVLWGKKWKKGGTTKDGIHNQPLRDAIHLDISWTNQADCFVTNEKALLSKYDELSSSFGFDVKILNPADCLTFLKAGFLSDFGTDDVKEISRQIRDTRPIIVGSNDCKDVHICDPESGNTLFRTGWVRQQLHVEARLYDSSGAAVADLAPEREPTIHHDDAVVHLDNFGPRVFYSLNNVEPDMSQCLMVARHPANRFVVVKGGEILLTGRMLPSGHIAFEGTFFNGNGTMVAEIRKRHLKHGESCLQHCSSDLLLLKKRA